MKTKSTFILVLLIFFSAAAVHAMRCGTEIVSDGSTKFEVLNACGEPMKKFGDQLEVGSTGINDGDDEKWVYDLGDGVYHIVYFDDFKVRKIEIERK